MVSTTFKCLQCGAELKFNPTTQNWKCEYCESAFSKEVLDANAEKAQKSVTTEAPQKINEEEGSGIVAYRCSYCSAEVVTTKDTSATFCVFCQRPVILENNLSGTFQPKYIIPFKNTKKEALATFQEYVKKKPFVPNEFKNQEHVEKITGVYVPFWLYSATVQFQRVGEVDDVSHWSDSNYRYTKTDTYSFQRAGTISFDKIPVDASTKTDNDIMDSIEPFDFSELKDFDIPYLSGFLAERFDETSDTCIQRAQPRMISSMDSEVNATLRSGVKRTDVNEHEFTQIAPEYALLPIWLLSTPFEDKTYTFAMNGQTGKFMGNIPLDKKKVFKHGLICFLVSTAIIFLVAFICLLF